jgi:hypothetical protein
MSLLLKEALARVKRGVQGLWDRISADIDARKATMQQMYFHGSYLYGYGEISPG